MKNVLLGILLISSFLRGAGQNPSNDMLKEKFAFEILHIDEFIERFNFDSSNKLIQYLENESNGKLSRQFILEKMIRLENCSDQGYLISEFVNFVNDSVSPYYLSFYDDNWYAQLHCSFTMDNKEIPVDLILTTSVRADSASKWVIKSVDSDFIFFPESEDPKPILSPVSQNTDFAGLHNCLDDKENLMNYFADDFKPDVLTHFYSLLYFGRLKLKEVNKVTYHFLQVPKWIFSVNYYNVKDLQSGWLITELYRVNQLEKQDFENNVLHF